MKRWQVVSEKDSTRCASALYFSHRHATDLAHDPILVCVNQVMGLSSRVNPVNVSFFKWVAALILGVVNDSIGEKP